MLKKKNIFLNKSFLIYGLGKSGISSFLFLKKNNKVDVYDDNKPSINKKIKKSVIKLNEVNKKNYDFIVISPGIDIKKCKLKSYLKKNLTKIVTDLDVFYNKYGNNKNITITGTNGKSTTCQLLYEVLKKQGYDIKLAGNIGYPILSIKNIKPKSIFVIEASSYQLQYSKIFSSKYSTILNIKPDHLERHKTLKEYIKTKFKLINNQKSNSIAFVNKFDKNINEFLKKNTFKSKIIKVNTRLNNKYLLNFKNNYFLSTSNKENLLFVLEIIKRYRINKRLLIRAITNFKGLKYRQQTIYNKKNLKIINDSKSTSYSSSIEMLKTSNNIYWLLGGIPKKGDKFNLSKIYYKNISGYIFGKKSNKFLFDLQNKIKFKRFSNLKKALKAVCRDTKTDRSNMKTILFSPAAASFDSFKNFEDRGFYFNKIIKKYFNDK